MSNRILLIDGDVVAYKAAASCEVATEWEPGFWTWHCSFEQVQASVETQVEEFMDTLKGDEFKLCLTDSARNFRLDILPTYKGNRKGVNKPLALMAVRQWMIEEKGAYLRPRLEGDDCMGILATAKTPGEKIIVSVDKDMKTIPGLFYRNANDGLVEIDEATADYWHLFQTLTGDATDGYSGCPGVGPKKAEAILKEDPSWAAVVAAYAKAGLGEEEALTQARVARILRASDYDFSRKEPKLWKPRT